MRDLETQRSCRHNIVLSSSACAWIRFSSEGQSATKALAPGTRTDRHWWRDAEPTSGTAYHSSWTSTGSHSPPLMYVGAGHSSQALLQPWFGGSGRQLQYLDATNRQRSPPLSLHSRLLEQVEPLGTDKVPRCLLPPLVVVARWGRHSLRRTVTPKRLIQRGAICSRLRWLNPMRTAMLPSYLPYNGARCGADGVGRQSLRHTNNRVQRPASCSRLRRRSESFCANIDILPPCCAGCCGAGCAASYSSPLLLPQPMQHRAICSRQL